MRGCGPASPPRWEKPDSGFPLARIAGAGPGAARLTAAILDSPERGGCETRVRWARRADLHSPAVSDIEANLALARRVYELWNTGGVEAFEQVWALDVVYHEAPEFPDTGVLRGAEAFAAHCRELVGRGWPLQVEGALARGTRRVRADDPGGERRVRQQRRRSGNALLSCGSVRGRSVPRDAQLSRRGSGPARVRALQHVQRLIADRRLRFPRRGQQRRAAPFRVEAGLARTSSALPKAITTALPARVIALGAERCAPRVGGGCLR
jgi:ketosteroid isomerase-like protein